MKNLSILLFALFAFNAFGQGDAPPFIQGQSQTTKAVATVIKAPNNQTTKLSSSQALLETGNKNLLVNPSFEHQTYSTGWVNSFAAGVETTIVLDGAKSFKATQVTSIVSMRPTDVTTYQAQFADGSVSALASISVKAGFSVKICARKAGVTTSQCSNGSRGDSKWETIQIAFPLGATSNGFEVLSDSAVTGDIYFDDAYFGFNPNFSALVNLSQDTDWEACTFSTLAWQGWGTVTSNLLCKREGSDLVISGKVAVGTVTGSEIQIPLPRWRGQSLSLKSILPTVNVSLGRAVRSNIVASNLKDYTLIGSPSGTYLGVSVPEYSQALNPIDRQTGTGVSITADTFSFEAVRLPIQGWNVSSPNIVTTNDTFSTDTAALFHKATPCLSTEIGCFNTYSYNTPSSNTATICASTPAQTIASMNADGIRIFTRAYNAASTCGNPARVILVTGKNYKGVDKFIYKDLASVSPRYAGEFSLAVDGAVDFGFRNSSYSSNDGTIILDAGTRGATNTQSLILYGDIGSATSGYVVINASKNPAMSGIDAGDFVKSSGSQGKTELHRFYFSSTGVVTDSKSDLVNGNCTNANPTVCTWNTGKFSPSWIISCSLTSDNVGRAFRALDISSTSATFTEFVTSTGAATGSLGTGAWVICVGDAP